MKRTLLTWIALTAIGLFLCAAAASAQEPEGVADRLLEDLQSPAAQEKRPEGAPAAPSWRGVADEMSLIAKQLPDPSTARETLAAQAAIIKQLERLLQESKPASGGSTTPQGATTSENRGGGRPEAARPPEERVPAAPGQGPATTAGAPGEGGKGEGAAGTPVNLETLVRRAWGQLPGRVRDRLLSSTPEKFLPKYQAETEQYFRRLSEMEHQP